MSIKEITNGETRNLVHVLHFNRSNPNADKKFRKPFKREDLLDCGFDGVLPGDFCKKDPETLIQRRLLCNACRCQMESSEALKEHVSGEKHRLKVAQFVPDKVVIDNKTFKSEDKTKRGNKKCDIKVTLKEVLLMSVDGAEFRLIGLDKVQEFRCPDRPELPRMYKCTLFDCDGSWGTAQLFAKHLSSKKHSESFLNEHNLKEEDLEKIESVKLSQVESKLEVISNDAERYWIQADRVPTLQRFKKKVRSDLNSLISQLSCML